MKVSYKLVGVGGYVVLCDDTAGTGPATWTPLTRGAVQDEPLFRSSSKFRAPRGNLSASLSLVWNQEYADTTASLAATRTMAELKNQKLHLRVEQGSEIHYYPNATLEECRPSLTGRSVDHSLVFASDDVTTAQPTT